MGDGLYQEGVVGVGGGFLGVCRSGEVGAVVGESSTGAAAYAVVIDDFSFVDDFFPTDATDGARSWAADDVAKGCGEGDFLPGEEVFVGHALVAEELCFPALGGFGYVGGCDGAYVDAWCDADGAFGVGVDAGGGYFSVVGDAQGTPADPASGGDGDAIGSAAVGFDDGEESFVGLWEVEAQELRGEHADANTEDLARAEVAVQGGAGLEECFELVHWLLTLIGVGRAGRAWMQVVGRLQRVLCVDAVPQGARGRSVQGRLGC